MYKVLIKAKHILIAWFDMYFFATNGDVYTLLYPLAVIIPCINEYFRWSLALQKTPPESHQEVYLTQ